MAQSQSSSTEQLFQSMVAITVTKRFEIKTAKTVSFEKQGEISANILVPVFLQFKFKIITAYLTHWTCLVSVFAAVNESTDVFENMSGLAPATSIELECSTERQHIYRGTILRA